MAVETVKKIYKYSNRVKATIPPGIKSKIQSQKDATGDSESRIVANALDFYFKNQTSSGRVAKNGY